MFLNRFLTCYLVMLLSAGTMTSCTSNTDDEKLQKVLAEKLPAGVSASVKKGVVTLSGSCPDEMCIANASQVANDVEGVASVVNNIHVTIIGDAGVNISPDDILMDEVNKVVNDYPSVNASVKDGVVTLTGTIQKQQYQQLMDNVKEINPAGIDDQLAMK